MDQHSTTEPRTALDKSFDALRRLDVRRRTDDKWIAGVCSGVADRLRVDPVIVRIALVVLSIFWGFGITLYLVAWALLPNDRNEISAERAIRDGDGGSVVLLIVAAFALFGGSWWSNDASWAFPVLFILIGPLIWWLSHRQNDRPDADQRVSAHQSGLPFTGGQPPAGQPPAGQPPAGQPPMGRGPAVTPVPTFPVAPRPPRRKSGGALMALVAIGVALLTYGILSWLGAEYSWTGDHRAIALAGSLAAMGLVLVGLGLAGWRAGFAAFLTVVLAIIAWSSTVVPPGIYFGGRVGDETWAPTTVVSDTSYNLGVGSGVLDLRELPTEGLSEARLPVYVGLGELTVIVPDGLTVKVDGHAGLGEIVLPGDEGESGQDGTDVSRSAVIGEGPTEVLVSAGVGVGQITVVKE